MGNLVKRGETYKSELLSYENWVKVIYIVHSVRYPSTVASYVLASYNLVNRYLLSYTSRSFFFFPFYFIFTRSSPVTLRKLGFLEGTSELMEPLRSFLYSLSLSFQPETYRNLESYKLAITRSRPI